MVHWLHTCRTLLYTVVTRRTDPVHLLYTVVPAVQTRGVHLPYTVRTPGRTDPDTCRTPLYSRGLPTLLPAVHRCTAVTPTALPSVHCCTAVDHRQLYTSVHCCTAVDHRLLPLGTPLGLEPAPTDVPWYTDVVDHRRCTPAVSY